MHGLFQGRRRRAEICCLASIGQILSGSTLACSPAYFFTQVYMESSCAFQFGVLCTAVAFIGTALSRWLTTHLDRRTLYTWGQGVLCTTLFLIGIINASTNTTAGMWAQAGLCFVWLLVNSLTVGPIAYAIMSETSPVRPRPLTVCLARTAYQIVNVVSQVLEPYFMNPTAWNASGKTGFFWGAAALIAFTWAYARLTEPKDRTHAELNILFVAKVPARKFASTHADAVGISPSREGLVREGVEGRR